MAGEDAILSWAGKTADSFIEEFQEAPGKLKKLKRSYDLAGDALASYWPDLETAQEQADKALRDGRAARADLTTAQGALGTADADVRTAEAKADSYAPDKNPDKNPDSNPDRNPDGNGAQGREVPEPDEAQVRRAARNATHARERQEAARGRVQDAQGALEAAKRLAEQARGLRQEAARRTVRKIEDASDAGIPNRHWWEEAVDWVADHWDEIVTVCKWVVTIVGIIVMIVGGPLGWLVFAAALVVMADTIRKVVNGEAGWGDLIWAALDCIPATKGFTSLAKLGKLWKAGGLRALAPALRAGINEGLAKSRLLFRSLPDVGAVGRSLRTAVPSALSDAAKALHAGSADMATLRQVIKRDYPFLTKINAENYHRVGDGFRVNCAYCAQELDKALAGKEFGQAVGHRIASNAQLAKDLGVNFHVSSGYHALVKDFERWGEGARGVVIIARKDLTAHAFNVVHDGNGVVFLDAQKGGFAKLEKFETLMFARTK